ncbi:MAG TPA: hypothetical protein VGB28_01800 [Actinomycetota bacterium]|jgi:hypothetical protein
MLRDLRKSAGYRAVKDAASAPDCPAALQTIYAYERGGLMPSLPQFLELVEFYSSGKGADGVRYMAVAAIHRALALPSYPVRQAHELAERLQPEPSRGRRRKA